MSENEKFEYFMERTAQDFADLKASVEDLKRFKFTWTGGLVVINGIITIALTLITLYFGR